MLVGEDNEVGGGDSRDDGDELRDGGVFPDGGIEAVDCIDCHYDKGVDGKIMAVGSEEIGLYVLHVETEPQGQEFREHDTENV